MARDINQFNVHDTAVAVLLEGKFKSLYAGRIPQSFVDTMARYKHPVKTVCDADNKMIVVADGDIALNQVSQKEEPLSMAENLNFRTTLTYANKDFYTNSLEYLVNPS